VTRSIYKSAEGETRTLELYDRFREGLGLDRAAFVGGSFGASIILRLAAYAPSRFLKMALFVPRRRSSPTLWGPNVWREAGTVSPKVT
jgi:pimeloyl-ACP methyl ester carboxylesterase